jgi:hypothetical protein
LGMVVKLQVSVEFVLFEAILCCLQLSKLRALRKAALRVRGVLTTKQGCAPRLEFSFNFIHFASFFGSVS